MKKVLSAGVMLLACCACLPTAHAQSDSASAAAQPGNEAVREAKPKNPRKRGTTRTAKTTAAEQTGEQTPPVEQSDLNTAGAQADAASYYAIGMSHYESKRFRDAVEAFKQSIRLGSTDPKTYYSLGQAYYSLNLYKEARESYKRAAKVRPDWAEAHYQLGWMYHILGDKASSQAQYKILQTLNPEMAESFQKLLGNDAKPATAPTTNAANLNASTTEPSSTNTTIEKDAAQATIPEAAAADNNQATSSSPANTSSSVDASSQSPAAAATEVASQQPAASEATPDATANGAQVNTAANGTGANPSGASAPSTSATTKDGTATTTTAEPAAAVSNSSEMPPTSIYRVGTGDVLDIRLLNTPNSRSTLFTVMSGGLIEYPLVGGSFTVAGLTTEEIGARLSAELKRRGLGNDSQVVVGVRDYSSHVVIVSGLVNYPGRKILQREAVPLYVIAAEAQLRPDAGRAVIMRASESIPVNDLTDPSALNVLVKPGDVITVSARQPLYYFIGGRINSPGQKAYQQGITLIQAILAAGGLTRAQDTVEISREEPDGRLTTTKYALKEIKSGKIPDPRLQPGDRIQVGQ
jgi:polysaccharide biosynthesis/export protein